MDNLCNVSWAFDANRKRLDMVRAGIKASKLDRRYVKIEGRAKKNGWGEYTLKILGGCIVGRTMNGTDYWTTINTLRGVIKSIEI